MIARNEPDLPADAGRSWWLRDALAHDPGEPAPPLAGDVTADVVILGAGYTGMWTALHLTDLDPGIDIVLLEQDIAGGGASGRNGGFVNSFWSELEYLAQRFGAPGQTPTCARRLACSAAMRIAAAIGRGSARSCPAMSKAVP